MPAPSTNSRLSLNTVNTLDSVRPRIAISQHTSSHLRSAISRPDPRAIGKADGRAESFLISPDIYQGIIESSSRIKETRNEQTKRLRRGIRPAEEAIGGENASSLFDPGALIPGVITNKFSTRNEVKKRERVNPKVRPKGVRSLDTRQTGNPLGAMRKP